ncbi:Ankyrin repeat-containing protein [Fulvia fulva]|uniref:Ankyrin repeat-containing protein n=1 Tax=Passalora fulva TaxID=5499 RepID=A0A9Q8P2J0_PASFU|nr:Ankyrin repeat-containing protein [Fulvia fulva]KAK4635884.1 Ankyrin repeat-containing protein [Fulvia fulva]KAK4638602.1 Ankyrin repeat-containing protein [Fulvia fulva]UJO10814.1 Ankyrin repeat-containing protein [Fulvia fulva]WPV10291.1 Ankyrin repeat-containing protein [Fulvia fulva]WPV24662.1 Ankyrin repeat-containing protein [Fulvia fulva]
MAQTQTPTTDLLLNLAAEHPDRVLQQLQSHPHLASKQDAHGYSLVHAAASYGHSDLLRALIRTYNVDPNIKDEDGETALFNVEEVKLARELIELGTDPSARNDEGQIAAEKLDDEDEQPDVAAYLRSLTVGPLVADLSEAATNGAGVHPPPPVPQGMQVNVGTMAADEAGEAPDPEFRRRIEELAAREDFQDEAGQAELRRLVEEAVSGVRGGEEGQGNGLPPSSRRRVD